MRPHTVLAITMEYAQFGALEQVLLRRGLALHDSAFTDVVHTTVYVPVGDERLVTALVADMTAGSARTEAQDIIYLPQ
jgi:putative IMPACT (imprinted ancient) family translation regulator